MPDDGTIGSGTEGVPGESVRLDGHQGHPNESVQDDTEGGRVQGSIREDQLPTTSFNEVFERVHEHLRRAGPNPTTVVIDSVDRMPGMTVPLGRSNVLQLPATAGVQASLGIGRVLGQNMVGTNVRAANGSIIGRVESYDPSSGVTLITLNSDLTHVARVPTEIIAPEGGGNLTLSRGLEMDEIMPRVEAIRRRNIEMSYRATGEIIRAQEEERLAGMQGRMNVPRNRFGLTQTEQLAMDEEAQSHPINPAIKPRKKEVDPALIHDMEMEKPCEGCNKHICTCEWDKLINELTNANPVPRSELLALGASGPFTPTAETLRRQQQMASANPSDFQLESFSLVNRPTDPVARMPRYVESPNEVPVQHIYNGDRLYPLYDENGAEIIYADGDDFWERGRPIYDQDGSLIGYRVASDS
jgi:hypothetical protein